VLFDDPEDVAGLADCLISALDREWDDARIREHVAARSWNDVAERVAAQWQAAVETSAPPEIGDARRSEKPAAAAQTGPG